MTKVEITGDYERELDMLAAQTKQSKKKLFEDALGLLKVYYHPSTKQMLQMDHEGKCWQVVLPS